MRLWFKRILLGLIGLVSAIVIGGSIWEAFEWRETLVKYPPSGKLVDIGGRKMHIDCRGEGSPTVVLEAGLDVAGVIDWALVHDALARKTRTCAYDRAGIVWSEPSNGVRDATTIARDLHATLAAAGEKAPYVMVGHSLGGPYIMTYTKLFGSEVEGLVFVDASHPDQIEKFATITGKTEQPGQMLHKLAASLSWTGLVRALSDQVDQPRLDRALVAAMRAYLPRSLGHRNLELASLKASLTQAGGLNDLGDRPVVVLSATAPMASQALARSGLSVEMGKAILELKKEMHKEQAAWSKNSRHELIDDASHYIQLDRPDVVIRAVQDVVRSVRTERSALPR